MTEKHANMPWSAHVGCDLEQQMRDWRRHLHAYPELGFEEHETTKYIVKLLDAWRIPYEQPLKTGAVAHVHGAAPGPILALRCDIDALPIREENTFDFASHVPGRMHACGHDAHTAILLGAAKTLAELRDEIRGEVRLLFQPAEELVSGGAQKFVDAGVLEGVEALVGLHVQSEVDVGAISLRGGPIMASDDQFAIEIVGSGGHGAHPHRTIDALRVAAGLIGELQTLISRQIDPLEPAVLTVGTLHAGTAYNIIAGRAEMSGTVRTFSGTVRNQLEEKITSLASTYARAHGAEAAVRYTRGSPAVINHPELVDFLRPAAAAVVGTGQVLQHPPKMGGEDFAYYCEVVPSAFVQVGGRNPDVGANFPHHHPRFTIDERCLGIGLRFYLETLERSASSRGTLPVLTAATGIETQPAHIPAQ
ncbi:MAG TPA: amidohydrolase [Chloroflexota bacterium]